MRISKGGRRALVLVVAIASGTTGRAAEQGDRSGTVVAARSDLQRQLGELLTTSLQGPAEPYRVEALVRLELRGVVREIHAKQQAASPAVKIGGGKNRVKLPGLGMVDGGIQGGSVLPEINIEGGTRVTESVSRQLETEVVKQTVLLYVDPKMPKERRELLVRLSSDLADIDPARGDEIAVEDRPAGSASSPPVVAATVEAAPRFGLALLAGCVTLLFCAGIIAFGFSKRGAQFGATITGGQGPQARGDGSVPGARGRDGARARPGRLRGGPVHRARDRRSRRARRGGGEAVRGDPSGAAPHRDRDRPRGSEGALARSGRPDGGRRHAGAAADPE